jgi:hypothetical protein
MHRDGPLRLSIDLFCPHQDKVARRRVRLRFSPSRILAHDGKSAVFPDVSDRFLSFSKVQLAAIAETATRAFDSARYLLGLLTVQM